MRLGLGRAREGREGLGLCLAQGLRKVVHAWSMKRIGGVVTARCCTRRLRWMLIMLLLWLWLFVKLFVKYAVHDAASGVKKIEQSCWKLNAFSNFGCFSDIALLVLAFPCTPWRLCF